MSPSSSVFASVFVITATTIVRRIREDKWQGHVIETIIFGFLLLVALQLLVLVLPNFAKVMGYLGIVGAFIVNGPAVFGYIGEFGRGAGGGVNGPRIGRSAPPRRAGRSG